MNFNKKTKFIIIIVIFLAWMHYIQTAELSSELLTFLMVTKKMIGLFIILTTTFISADHLVIEDFENNRANWDPVSDQVMGGLSELKFSELTLLLLRSLHKF